METLHELGLSVSTQSPTDSGFGEETHPSPGDISVRKHDANRGVITTVPGKLYS